MKKDGFTLIELLAVIVILAILVLLATPAVTSMMQKSAKNSFSTEISSFVHDLEKAYADKLMATNSDIKNMVVDVNDDMRKSSVLCMTLEDLVKEQYTQKNLGSNYNGIVYVIIPDDGSEKKVGAYITNGKYVYEGKAENINLDDVVLVDGSEENITCDNFITNINNEDTSRFTNYITKLYKSGNSDLVKDETDDHNIRYIGANPANYVELDGEIFRVIGIFNSNTHGVSNVNLVKLIKNESIGRIEFFNEKKNDFAVSPLKEKLNSDMYPYYNNELVSEVTFKTGAVLDPVYKENQRPGLIIEIYNDERGNKTNTLENYHTSFVGKVALPYLSDFYYSVGGSKELRSHCINDALVCTWGSYVDPAYTHNNDPFVWNPDWGRVGSGEYTKENYDASEPGVCVTNSWMSNFSLIWLLGASDDGYNTNLMANVKHGAGIQYFAVTRDAHNVAPSFYLKSSVKCTNCNEENVGTQSNPFKLNL